MTTSNQTGMPSPMTPLADVNGDVAQAWYMLLQMLWTRTGAGRGMANVAITGGTVDGASIGSNTPAAGAFSQMTLGEAATLLNTSVTLSNGAGSAAGTISNAPVAGNPTKWIAINDNGIIRHIPAW